MSITHFILLSCLWILCLNGHAQQGPTAFPGAEGFGKNATGGRGGKVIIVANLNDDGPGSLRDAIRKKYPRIIVFAVSGNVELASPLDINNGDVTIAGQSAPGDGICIKNYTLNVKADNVIIRFLRFRLGDEKKFQGDALSGTSGKRNIIIDHCSMSWSTDECASFYKNHDFTLQWCIISESLKTSIHTKGDHGYGGIWGGVNASFHHNLIASHTSRMPRFSGSASTPNRPDELVDFRNNVIYNWMNNNIYGGEKGRYNLVNNYFKPGPATKAKVADQIVNPWAPYGAFFISGNFFFANDKVTRDNSVGVRTEDKVSVLRSIEFPVQAIAMHDPEEGYELVLRLAGASLKRDEVDQRVVEEVRSGNLSKRTDSDGIIDSQKEVGGWPLLKPTRPPDDLDQDGMPDTWELAQKLNPKDPADACKKTVGEDYDNIEVYLNSLVKTVVVQ
jgi:pectate lyase